MIKTINILVLLVSMFVLSPMTMAQSSPEPRVVEHQFIIEPVAETGTAAPAIDKVDVDQEVISQLFKFIAKMPGFQQFVTWFVLFMGIVGILNYIALLTPWPWDDAILQPLNALLRKIYSIYLGWRRGY